jgi:hypothetical protein
MHGAAAARRMPQDGLRGRDAFARDRAYFYHGRPLPSWLLATFFFRHRRAKPFEERLDSAEGVRRPLFASQARRRAPDAAQREVLRC